MLPSVSLRWWSMLSVSMLSVRPPSAGQDSQLHITSLCQRDRLYNCTQKWVSCWKDHQTVNLTNITCHFLDVPKGCYIILLEQMSWHEQDHAKFDFLLQFFSCLPIAKFLSIYLSFLHSLLLFSTHQYISYTLTLHTPHPVPVSLRDYRIFYLKHY